MIARSQAFDRKIVENQSLNVVYEVCIYCVTSLLSMNLKGKLCQSNFEIGESKRYCALPIAVTHEILPFASIFESVISKVKIFAKLQRKSHIATFI